MIGVVFLFFFFFQFEIRKLLMQPIYRTAHSIKPTPSPSIIPFQDHCTQKTNPSLLIWTEKENVYLRSFFNFALLVLAAQLKKLLTKGSKGRRKSYDIFPLARREISPALFSIASPAPFRISNENRRMEG